MCDLPSASSRLANSLCLSPTRLAAPQAGTGSQVAGRPAEGSVAQGSKVQQGQASWLKEGLALGQQAKQAIASLSVQQPSQFQQLPPTMTAKLPLPLQSDWSLEEDTILENTLAECWDASDRLEKAASRLPLRSLDQVKHRFRLLEEDIINIEAGRIPLPSYSSAQEHTSMERRKGIPWTEDEHRLFLMGLAKFGKGDWRSISRNYVMSRTPTQVASHAQKYFIRLNSQNKKDKRRSSIHDITSPGGNSGEITGMMPPGGPQQQHMAMQAANVMGSVAPGVPMQQRPVVGMQPRQALMQAPRHQQLPPHPQQPGQANPQQHLPVPIRPPMPQQR